MSETAEGAEAVGPEDRRHSAERGEASREDGFQEDRPKSLGNNFFHS